MKIFLISLLFFAAAGAHAQRFGCTNGTDKFEMLGNLEGEFTITHLSKNSDLNVEGPVFQVEFKGQEYACGDMGSTIELVRGSSKWGNGKCRLSTRDPLDSNVRYAPPRIICHYYGHAWGNYPTGLPYRF